MANPMQAQNVAGTDNQSSVVEESSLRYSSDCAVYIFFGKNSRDPQSTSNIWIRMTRQDLDSPEIFRRALTRYIQAAINLGMTHYYSHFGDILIFPIPWPPHERYGRRLILRTEPLKTGQMYSLLPEHVNPEPFPMNLTAQHMIEGNPLDGPCRQIQFLETEGVGTTQEESWSEKVENIRRLRELAEREGLPPDLNSFAYIVGADANPTSDVGRGAWADRRLGLLLTEEYLNSASEQYARETSAATVNGWHE